MRKWFSCLEKFYKDKRYVLALSLVAACAYGYKVTHVSIGIDDTPYAYYFEEGLAAIVGRWVIFLLNKVVALSEFAPLVTDLAAVLLLMAAVTVWCALLYSVLGERIPWYGYFFYAGIFLSCPLISEVFTYYLHNGIAIGYLCTGISLCCFRELQCRFSEGIARQIRQMLLTAVFLWIALGCYESFMIVWLLGVLLLLLTERFAGTGEKMFRSLLAAGLVGIAGLVLRSVMITLVVKLFDLEYLQGEAVQRSVTEMAAWLFQPGAFSEFAMVLKRIFVMYGVFGYAYYPIRIFLLASLALVVYSLWRAVRGRDLWVVLLLPASFVTAFVLVIIEGKATLYRSAQFLPLLCGYGALLLVYGMHNMLSAGSADRHRWGFLMKAAVVLALTVVLWNQCMDMNRWFYVDTMKYRAAVETVDRIARDLEASFDTGKPVVFTGTYEVPRGIIQDAYVEYGSETYYKMKRITDLVDEHLLEKFDRSYGVWVAQTPALSVIDWGRYAFGDDSELVRFFAMQGHDLTPLTDTSLYQEAEEFSLTLPEYPKEGYIADMGDYLIVHF